MTDNDFRMAACDARTEADDDAAEIRFSLTALGEAAVVERARRRFVGFGPCRAATLPSAG